MQNPFRKMLGSNRELECKTDPETKELVCQTFRKNKDGTREPLAFQRMQVGSDCTPVITEAKEFIEGELDILEGKTVKKVVADCTRTRDRPQEY